MGLFNKTLINFVLSNGTELEVTVEGTLERVMEEMQLQLSISGGREFVERVDFNSQKVVIVRVEDISSVSMYQVDD